MSPPSRCDWRRSGGPRAAIGGGFRRAEGSFERRRVVEAAIASAQQRPPPPWSSTTLRRPSECVWRPATLSRPTHRGPLSPQAFGFPRRPVPSASPAFLRVSPGSSRGLFPQPPPLRPPQISRSSEISPIHTPDPLPGYRVGVPCRPGPPQLLPPPPDLIPFGPPQFTSRIPLPLTAVVFPPHPRAAHEREPPGAQGRWYQEAALGGAHLPKEDAAGAHPAPARHLHRLRGAGHPGTGGAGPREGRGAKPPELLSAGEKSLTSVYKAQNLSALQTDGTKEEVYLWAYVFLAFFSANVGF